ncbi:MAG: thiol-disulfide isomerase [Acidobacteria bacterium]|nr:thiol-disulfide isomerase [Acidobacteriota bacterium]
MIRITFFAAMSVSAACAYAAPTFTKDVAPILNRRCVECHRRGEAAPMAFTSYKEVRPWAKAIREAVLLSRMPVWLADPAHGQFKNERRLTQAEKDTIARWVDEGAPEGDPKHLPDAPQFVEGWNIGKPDVVFDIGADYEVPASGVVPYRYFDVPSNFTEDTWVEAAEIRPNQRQVVHHVIVFMRDAAGKQIAKEGGDLLVGWAPGEEPLILEPGTAKLVKAGTRFRIQMHYTPAGKPVKDRTYFGLRFARKPPGRQAIVGRALNARFRIPPLDPNHEVRADWKFDEPVEIYGFMPHMHLRGKDFKYTLVYPDGREQVVLNVPRYDFNWQLNYVLKEPLRVPAGSRLDCVAHFDNSRNNKANPDPAKEVRWGDQTWEEMMIGWFSYTLPAGRDRIQARAAER